MFNRRSSIFQVNHLENLSKSQGIYGETWEIQYRNAFSELQSLRDENAMLKTKINRQNRQIELLTRMPNPNASSYLFPSLVFDLRKILQIF